MSPKQGGCGKNGNYTHDSLVNVNPGNLRGIEPQKVQKEASDWICN